MEAAGERGGKAVDRFLSWRDHAGLWRTVEICARGVPVGGAIEEVLFLRWRTFVDAVGAVVSSDHSPRLPGVCAWGDYWLKWGG